MHLQDRLIAARKSTGKTQTAFAQDLGINQRSWQGYEAGKNLPGTPILEALSRNGFDVNWILTGEGSMKRGAAQAVESDEFAYIPLYSALVSAGHGAINGTDTVVEKVAFRRDWLKNRGLDAEQLALVHVMGDSMLPTLTSGDMLMLDLRCATAKENAIYAIEKGGDIRVKRLQPKMDGSIIVRSDNTAYEPEIISEPEAQRLRVIGRAVWVGKAL